MFDIQLRGFKDRLFISLVPLVPSFVTPGHLTTAGFVLGILACISAATSNHAHLAVYLWLLNRIFDCLDGALARHRHVESDAGAFYDLLCDFIVYSAIPVAVGIGQSTTSSGDGERLSVKAWIAIAFLEATFHINNFVLFYFAAIEAKPEHSELTSVAMVPAPIEGFESALFFTAMMVFRPYIAVLSWVMGALVVAGVVMRSWSLFDVLSRREDETRSK